MSTNILTKHLIVDYPEGMDKALQSQGGRARAAALTPEARREIAQMAADARWGGSVLRATHDGSFIIGQKTIAAAVLENKKRVLTQETFLTALERAAKAKGGTGSRTRMGGLPTFLVAENLKPFITDEVIQATTPIVYRNLKGQRTIGYDAELLPMVCEVYLGLRDYANSIRETEPGQYSRIMNLQGRVIQAADVLMRGLARVGIIAMVDEATGYQEDRAKDELAKILEAYISPKLLPWTQKFPHEFFRQVYRLHGWQYKPGCAKHPQYLGKFINKYVYGPFPPGILEALQAKNPVTDSGYRKHKNHQFLTVDTGDPHLDRVIVADITLMQVSQDKKQFGELFDRAMGKPQQTRMNFEERPPLVIDTTGEILPQDFPANGVFKS
ncbi:MAG TPA: P63C domain-containing protein [Bryobacteraceae bacterium]|nr:P63C domain-containing protein [Bryobacteraceae bacterium]